MEHHITFVEGFAEIVPLVSDVNDMFDREVYTVIDVGLNIDNTI